MMLELGREGWRSSPVYFYKPGSGNILETYAVPIELTEHICVYRINSPDVIKHLIKLEDSRPGSMKKGLSWLAPFPNPPCWHQISSIRMESDRLGVIVTLKLGAHHVDQA